jgi:hypothetical protein
MDQAAPLPAQPDDSLIIIVTTPFDTSIPSTASAIIQRASNPLCPETGYARNEVQDKTKTPLLTFHITPFILITHIQLCTAELV